MFQVSLLDFDGNSYIAKYGSFKVGSADQNYKLSVSEYDTSSTLLDAFNWGSTVGDFQNGKEFSTKDSPNRGNAMDSSTGTTDMPCAEVYRSGKHINNCKIICKRI